jgi:hypothetical protein
MEGKTSFPSWGESYREDSEISLFTRDDSSGTSRFIQLMAMNGSCTIAFVCTKIDDTESRHTTVINHEEYQSAWEPLILKGIDELKTVYIFPQQEKSYLITLRYGSTVKKVAGMGPIVQADLKRCVDRLLEIAVNYFPNLDC